MQDLKKLFGKCGPLINATFDTNEFGSYLGTATVAYLGTDTVSDSEQNQQVHRHGALPCSEVRRCTR